MKQWIVRNKILKRYYCGNTSLYTDYLQDAYRWNFRENAERCCSHFPDEEVVEVNVIIELV